MRCKHRNLYPVVLFLAGLLSSCATAGRLEYGKVTYRLNCWDIKQEEDGRYCLWAWRNDAGMFDFLGDSPAGVQILLPEGVTPGTACTVADDCFLWVRGQWYLVGALINILWVPVESGLITVSRWDTESGMFSIEFSGSTLEGPLYGSIKVGQRSRCEDHIR